MPREMIRSDVGPYHVKVGWHADRGVQVGVETDEERSLFWLLLGNDEHALQRFGAAVRQAFPTDMAWGHAIRDVDIAKWVLNAADVRSSGELGGYRGVWADYNRQGVNDLIRILRRARDSAYGKDE